MTFRESGRPLKLLLSPSNREKEWNQSVKRQTKCSAFLLIFKSFLRGLTKANVRVVHSPLNFKRNGKGNWAIPFTAQNQNTTANFSGFFLLIVHKEEKSKRITALSLTGQLTGNFPVLSFFFFFFFLPNWLQCTTLSLFWPLRLYGSAVFYL